MANLMIRDQGVLNTDVNGAFPVCYQIGMDYYGHSKGPPLFTWGALPCMNVVVHNRGASRGCLTHVWNSSTDGAVLYEKAATAVQKMLTEAGNPAAADIYLFAGQAFIANSDYQLSKKQSKDVDEYLKPRFKTHYFWNGLHHAMGQVLYWPAKDTVYFLSDSERTSLQHTMVNFDKLNALQQLFLNVTVAKL
ncbi:MAG TPA: hypothetical protein VFY65_05300 [Longimicrobium sp.]|nr:hypothetical protein [Longimicrobium sp.]